MIIVGIILIFAALMALIGGSFLAVMSRFAGIFFGTQQERWAIFGAGVAGFFAFGVARTMRLDMEAAEAARAAREAEINLQAEAHLRALKKYGAEVAAEQANLKAIRR
jgi:hypothetical protein